MAAAHLCQFCDFHEHASDASICYLGWQHCAHSGGSHFNISYLQVVITKFDYSHFHNTVSYGAIN